MHVPQRTLRRGGKREGSGREGQREALRPKQKPKTSRTQGSDSGDTDRKRAGRVGIRNPWAKEEREGRKIKRLCEQPQRGWRGTLNGDGTKA